MGSGSCGNVIAALASFFIPGLGQLLQGRWLLAGFMFLLTALLWLILLGWVIHLWSIIDAALFEPPEPVSRRYSPVLRLRSPKGILKMFRRFADLLYWGT